MAAKKKAHKKTRRTAPTAGEAKFKRATRLEKQPRSVFNGRFESTLTEELVDELCTIHKEGDLVPGTALACGVHPELLTKWLEAGSKLDAPDPYARLFATFAVIEAEIRRDDFKKLRDPFTKNSAGIIWYLEKRNRMLRKEAVQRAGQIFNVAELLEPKAEGGMSKDAAIWIVQQLAQHMPDELKPIMGGAGWHKLTPEQARRLQLTEGQPNEPEDEDERDDRADDDGTDDDFEDDEDDR